tara:strand:- start:621 stop:860 length:240 start_codon:yes stop_codon:yes gene_type:complete
MKRVTQYMMAEWLNTSATSIQNWESGANSPSPAAQFIYNKLIEDPSFIAELQLWARERPEWDKKMARRARRAIEDYFDN